MRTINLTDITGQAKKYRPLGKKIIRTTNIQYALSKFIFRSICISSVLLGLRCYILENRIDNIEMALESISGENISELSSNDLQIKTTEMKEEYEYALSLMTENEKLNESIKKLTAGIVELDEENVSLVESNEKYYKELTALRERAELYDEYEYALVYNGERTDITFDQLKTGIDICNEANISPHLLFAFIMTESHGIESAKNPNSTATGYGQILNGTAKFVYEDLMNNGEGTFTNALSKDGDINIEMTARYIAYLKDHNSNLHDIIVDYAGEDNPEYIMQIEKWLAKADTSISEINKQIYSK